MMGPQMEIFREEAVELLNDLENSLLELEDRPEDRELVDKVFRALHTIKGSGAMFGFERIAEFTHEVETVFDEVRGGRLPVSGELVSLTLAARDRIISMLKDEEDEKDECRAAEIIASLQALRPEAGTGEVPAENKRNDKPEKMKSDVCTFRIRFKPYRHLLINGTNPLALLNELRDMGTCTVAVHSEAIPSLEEFDPESCYCSWDIILTTDRSREQEIHDVFIFVEDDGGLSIKVIDDVDAENNDFTLLGEILLDRGDISDLKLNSILAGQKKIGEVLVDARAVQLDKVEAALLEQQHVRGVRQQQENRAGTSIRVGSEKLDHLVDLVGELVTVQARFNQKAERLADPELNLIAENVGRLTEELRDNIMDIRMLPIGTLFSKFKRLVRDLSRELGKEVEMEVEGAETELDKTVIDKLNDPLVHLIRNSIDHGIEPPDRREAEGKPRVGKVRLSAEHTGANVLIRITDDGAGLDPETLRDKAVEKGLISADAAPAAQELYDMVFEAGFSTAQKVTDVSGRGVGMDVVRRSIESLGGAVEIKSMKSAGTTISLRLPLTLAIIDGLLVRIGEVFYVMPLAVVEECAEITRQEADLSRKRGMVQFRGEMLSYLSLRHQFNINGELPAIEQVVTVKNSSYRIGFGVDRVAGQHQTVIKNLGKAYRDVKGLSGATILGDGTVALILDVNMLMNLAEQKSCH
ncbi:MAG: chemotaxis protein CheA [Deltaproteobacteria bacterium]